MRSTCSPFLTSKTLLPLCLLFYAQENISQPFSDPQKALVSIGAGCFMCAFLPLRLKRWENPGKFSLYFCPRILDSSKKPSGRAIRESGAQSFMLTPCPSPDISTGKAGRKGSDVSFYPERFHKEPPIPAGGDHGKW